MPASRIAIVGAGLVGYTVARVLRAEGYAGEIVVVGAERHRPYDRPPLSKAYLHGEVDDGGLSLEAPGEHLDVDWRLGSAAVGLDASTRTLALADGSALTADHIVLATGAAPRRLPDVAMPVTGRGIAPLRPAAYVVGTIEDAADLRRALVPGTSVVVAGAGFVGLEVAATAAALGAASVTVVCADESPLRSAYGAEASAAVRALHERAGVRFVTGTRVSGVRRDGSGEPHGVVLADGRELEASVVVAGVGAVPATGWLADSGLRLTARGAVACDERGVAAPGVRAAGDCASWRDEPCAHWTRAREQAELVARDIVAPGAAAPSDAPAYVWSDQHGVRLQFAGRLRGGETATVEAGGIDTGDVFLVYRDDTGTEVAALGMDQVRLMMRWRKTHPAPLRPPGDAVAA
ncbi:NAD(P)/FAD-dependent oxidoreductase [Microbacterium sp. 18062]|uniref:NAD(P)/FAD-dependent oxidoreductase n=1 Tax=Microbacterium sp. 18062 TaxID=2681410 RepID=UPI001356F7EB|nr:FAD-dependent oxidoreductase [Microbacterium sp. 18062]